ncbi:MAG: hypothetical protein AAF628_19425 [Planctomycetota bacterium]
MTFFADLVQRARATPLAVDRAERAPIVTPASPALPFLGDPAADSTDVVAPADAVAPNAEPGAVARSVEGAPPSIEAPPVSTSEPGANRQVRARAVDVPEVDPVVAPERGAPVRDAHSEGPLPEGDAHDRDGPRPRPLMPAPVPAARASTRPHESADPPVAPMDQAPDTAEGPSPPAASREERALAVPTDTVAPVDPQPVVSVPLVARSRAPAETADETASIPAPVDDPERTLVMPVADELAVARPECEIDVARTESLESVFATDPAIEPRPAHRAEPDLDRAKHRSYDRPLHVVVGSVEIHEPTLTQPVRRAAPRVGTAPIGFARFSALRNYRRGYRG